MSYVEQHCVNLGFQLRLTEMLEFLEALIGTKYHVLSYHWSIVADSFALFKLLIFEKMVKQEAHFFESHLRPNDNCASNESHVFDKSMIDES